MYKIWGFVRQTAIKAYLACANAVYSMTGGKKPSLLYCKCDESHKIGTDVKIVSQNDLTFSLGNVKIVENQLGKTFIHTDC